jgi:hypothetical protein
MGGGKEEDEQQTGYSKSGKRWGKQLKHKLLRMERAIINI